jgi:MFS family permease
MSHSNEPVAEPTAADRLLFFGCFVSLITTSFGFILRAMTLDEWGVQFGLSATEKGEIFGAGLWPFAISIVLFSLVIDKVGYGRAMVFAFVCHVASVVMTVTANDYWDLYWANIVVALGNGTVEAVINPVVATMFRREKTKWLNILHAGWPGGLVLGGVLAVALSGAEWTTKFWLLLLPTVAYGLICLRVKFPVQERVAAGVSYVEMLREPGALGCFVVLGLVFAELWRVITALSSDPSLANAVLFHLGPVPVTPPWAAAAVVAVLFGLSVRALGQPLFFVLVLIMLPLATTELGTDGWITSLLEPEMGKLGLNAAWVLIYTSAIMMVLRLFAGAIVHRMSPLMLLMLSAGIAAVGLELLSGATGLAILAIATLYGVGKTFFWPTMLGIVSERFPKGGALTLNAISGVGMIAVGILGNPLFGYWQDTGRAERLAQVSPEIHGKVLADEAKSSVFGRYVPIDSKKVDALPEAERAVVNSLDEQVKRDALGHVAVLPIGMFVAYLALWLWFRARGGYKPVLLETRDAG